MRYLGSTYFRFSPFAVSFNEGGPWFNFHISKGLLRGGWFLYVFCLGLRWSNDPYHSGPYGRW